MAEPDLQFHATILKEVANAVRPYALDVEDLKRSIDRNERFAKEDHERMLAAVRGEVENIAEEVAERAVNRILDRFGLDPAKPDDFRKLVDWLNDLQKTIKDAKRHGLLVIVGAASLVVVSWFWTGFKASFLK